MYDACTLCFFKIQIISPKNPQKMPDWIHGSLSERWLKMTRCWHCCCCCCYTVAIKPTRNRLVMSMLSLDRIWIVYIISRPAHFNYSIDQVSSILFHQKTPALQVCRVFFQKALGSVYFFSPKWTLRYISRFVVEIFMSIQCILTNLAYHAADWKLRDPVMTNMSLAVKYR